MNTRDPKQHLMQAAITINGDRLWSRLMQLAQIGATPKGGVCRLALTELDRQARSLFLEWATALGCTIRIDAIGNISARRAGTEDHLPAIGTGSHIDTQPTGGKFDGNYGVLAGLEVIAALNDAGIRTRAPLEVCVWTNEEGSRFVPVMMGSGVYVNAFTLEHAWSAKDRDGISVKTALETIGFRGEAPASLSQGAPQFAAYFEAHIEQGPVLEAARKTIGVVNGALGQRWYDVTITGMEAHAGPTPMQLRRDALMPAAALVQEVNRIALSHSPHGRGTVGHLQVHPSSRNVIPGQVKMTVDFRHPTDEGLSAMNAALQTWAQAQTNDKISVVVEQVVYYPPAPFDTALQAAIAESAQQRGYSFMPVVSGAGHDAVYVARTAPAAMIFIPCKDGISHNEIEDADPAHIAAGAQVLLDAMLAQAEAVHP
jgi:beta-ureidopropionase / N-carbamoyl-L-amino-acid hydrolase